MPNTTPVKPIESLKDVKFSKGMLVEVSSDEDGFSLLLVLLNQWGRTSTLLSTKA